MYGETEKYQSSNYEKTTKYWFCILDEFAADAVWIWLFSLLAITVNGMLTNQFSSILDVLTKSPPLTSILVTQSNRFEWTLSFMNLNHICTDRKLFYIHLPRSKYH